MEIRIALLLPSEARTVPVARHICRETLRELAVEQECASDIEVALTEACTNVLDHSGPTDEFRVEVVLHDHHCEMHVVDSGPGFDVDAPRERADHAAESGRGIELMHALVDSVKFEVLPENGTVVHLHKQLAYADGASVLDRSSGYRK